MERTGKPENIVTGQLTISLSEARERVRKIDESTAYREFIETLRTRFPWRFQRVKPEALERDYLRIVDHHLVHMLPRISRYVEAGIRRVFDFGCGSGGSSIALAMVFPDLHCCGTDIDAEDIKVARERAALYGVAGRCEFLHVPPSETIPFPDASFDFCICSSVLEYVTDKQTRAFCIREMARLIKPRGLLFVSVPNRLYPFEVHTSKWGWNYFPRALHARIVDCGFWEVPSLARPARLRLHRTPLVQLFRPWSSLCYRKEGD